ncbi:MAG: T9SS type A sorting domain-containing protein [Elusimicrobiota bacterium]
MSTPRKAYQNLFLKAVQPGIKKILFFLLIVLAVEYLIAMAIPDTPIYVIIRSGEKGYVNSTKGESANIIIIANETDTVKIKVYTLNGDLIWEKEIQVTGGNIVTIPWACENIDKEKVAAGIYLVQIKGAGIDVKKKIAIVK